MDLSVRGRLATSLQDKEQLNKGQRAKIEEQDIVSKIMDIFHILPIDEF